MEEQELSEISAVEHLMIAHSHGAFLEEMDAVSVRRMVYSSDDCRFRCCS